MYTATLTEQHDSPTLEVHICSVYSTICVKFYSCHVNLMGAFAPAISSYGGCMDIACLEPQYHLVISMHWLNILILVFLGMVDPDYAAFWGGVHTLTDAARTMPARNALA